MPEIDPRVTDHLQTLCDEVWTSAVAAAGDAGLQIVIPQFDVLPEDLGNEFRVVLAKMLTSALG